MRLRLVRENGGGVGSLLLSDAWRARYTVEAWAVDRDPPPSVRWIWIVLFNAGVVAATRVAFPRSAWEGLALMAAVIPFVSLVAFYALRSWSRPRPIDEARAAHAYHQGVVREHKAAGHETFALAVPVSFSTMLQASVVVNLTAWFGFVGNYVFLAMIELDVASAWIVGAVVWSVIVVGGLFAVFVGTIGSPRWAMPYVVREAAKRGETVFNVEDFRAP